MLYSLLNTDNNFYVNICGELAILNLEESDLKQEKAIPEILNQIREEEIQKERLFIDFSGTCIWESDLRGSAVRTENIIIRFLVTEKNT